MPSLEFGCYSLAKWTHRMKHPRFWDQFCWWLTVWFYVPWLPPVQAHRVVVRSSEMPQELSTGLSPWHAAGAVAALPVSSGVSPRHAEGCLLQTPATLPLGFHLTLGRTRPSSGQAGNARELMSLEAALRWISSRVTSPLHVQDWLRFSTEKSCIPRNLSVPCILAWVHALQWLPGFPSCLCSRPARNVIESTSPKSAHNNDGELVRKYPADLPLGWDFFEVCPIPWPRFTQQELPEVPPAHDSHRFLALFTLCHTPSPTTDKPLQSCLCLSISFWRKQSQIIHLKDYCYQTLSSLFSP